MRTRNQRAKATLDSILIGVRVINPNSLTAILRTLATLCAALASLLAQETTAHDRQARHQASAVFLLLRWGLLRRRLLVAHRRLLVAILLEVGRSRAVAGIGLEEGCHFGVRSANCVIFSFRSASPTTGVDLRKIWFLWRREAYPYACCGCWGYCGGPWL
jgi:hypothetical protein